MMHLFEDPTFWVAVSFFTLIALLFRKISGFLGGALDSRSKRIKTDLDAAEKLREEAQQLLLTYKQRQAHYLKEAEDIIVQARQDAEQISANAQAELKASLDARMKMAMEKIAQEEASAVREVRNHAVDIAISAARVLLVEQLSSLPPDQLFRVALNDIERTIH